MSANRNTDSLANQAPGGGSGEFSSRVAPDEPMYSSGHQPGKLVGNDAAPEFQAEILPAGSAPADRTFQPNPTDETPPVANMSDRADPDSEQVHASDTIGGATSADVHTGLGHPGQGQTSTEIRHDGEKGRKNPGKSLEGVGASVEGFKTADASDPKFAHQRAEDRDDAVIGRENVGGLPAQEREPVTAETVAVEHGTKERQDRGT